MRSLYHFMFEKRSPIPVWLRFVAAICILSILLVPGGAASAHANLVRSDPPTGAALSQAPQAIMLEFSEDLDPGFSSVQLLNGSSQVVVAGPGQVDPAQPKVMRLKVAGLPDGVYSAVWRARSAVDGHITNGAVGFSVGASTSPVSLLPPPGTPDPATALPQPLDSLMRWLGYIMAAVMLGSPLFGLLIWQPVVHRSEGDFAEADSYVTQLLRRLSWVGIGGLVIATLGLALVQAGQASGKSFFDLFGPPLGTFLTTRTGALLGIRLALLAVLALITWRLPSIGPGRNRLWWLAAALGTGLLVTFSLQSHAAASDQAGPIILDTFHLLAMSTWMGGVLPLLILLRAAHRQGLSLPPLSIFIPRFSLVALVSVNTLAITGLYSAITQVQSADALLATTYGHTVIVKSILVAILVALGAVNLAILTPRLARSPDDPGRGFRRTTAVELGLGLIVLLAAGVLTSSQPAATALDAEHRLGFLGSADTDNVRLTLRVAPVQVGDNEFGVDVADNRPGASAVEPQVLLRLGLTGGALGQTQVEAAQSNSGRFTARGTYIVLPGQWEVDVIVRRSGFDDITHRFYMTVGTTSATGIASQEDTTPNPIQPDAASVAAGHTLYETNCVPCHGTSGKGDGPVGLTLNPRPANLTIHTMPGVHTDGQLFKWITEGYPGSVMPAFGKYLSETDRWNVVNYIRTLAQKMQ